MKKPAIRYLVASPAGDVTVDSHRLDYPLEADPLKINIKATTSEGGQFGCLGKYGGIQINQ